jgi:hypothetical protein
MKQKYILIVLLHAFVFNGFSQNNYQVTAIPFQQYTGSAIPLTTADDIYSPVITLPFSFNFYGTDYYQIVVSTNGYINFNTTNAGGTAPWSYYQTIPNTTFPAPNSILGCFHDMFNESGVGTITYSVYGTAPYRKFVVYFNNQPHFNCTSLSSSFQMILSETTNNIDIQLIDKPVCNAWNGGRAVTGLINATGTSAIAPPGRNTGAWTAYHEGWRFSRPNYYSSYSFVVCDDNSDGFASFNLNVAANDLSPNNPSAIEFYETFLDATIESNPLPSTYFNTNAFTQTIYASGNGQIIPVVLKVIDCAVDADNDTVPTPDEDVNNDTNLANDDTDGDGIPNYLDNDDDGDLVLTNLEYVFTSGRNVQNTLTLLDTDGDTIPNYLDNDDDGDGLLTWREDYNGDGNPTNDDTNTNGIPDYLEMGVALGVTTITPTSSIEIYPNPTSSLLTIKNTTGTTINTIEVYGINGALIKSIKANDGITTLSVSELQSGIYFVKIESNNQYITKKFVKL